MSSLINVPHLNLEECNSITDVSMLSYIPDLIIKYRIGITNWGDVKPTPIKMCEPVWM